MSQPKRKMSAREAALKILGEHRRKKAWSDLALNNVVNNSNLSAVETSLTVALVYGVLQNMALCDYYAARYSSMELKKLEPRILDILRLSIYQIVFLTKIPHNAAVNEGVKLAKQFSNQRASGYVNALLRKISKAMIEGSLPEITGSKLEVLSIKYSHPQWLVEEFFDVLGEEGTEAALKENNSANVPITAQINTLNSNTDEVISMMMDQSIVAGRHEWLKDCIEFRGSGNITRLDAFAKGHLYVQDAAARLTVIAANPKAGDFVIDGCAAPGGKSFTSAIMMENKGLIFACDVHAAKIRNIENGGNRLGIGIIEAIELDASSENYAQAIASAYRSADRKAGTPRLADVVIADVPCSGFGVIRKKPEIRYKSQQEIAGLPEIQRKILKSLSALVRPGGTLLYSTCTVLRCENEDIVESFLKENGDFEPLGFTLPGVGEVPDGMITLWPHLHGTDGFFMCKMRRTV